MKEIINKLENLGIDKLEIKFINSKENKTENGIIEIQTIQDLNKYHSLNGFEEMMNLLIYNFENKN